MNAPTSASRRRVHQRLPGALERAPATHLAERRPTTSGGSCAPYAARLSGLPPRGVADWSATSADAPRVYHRPLTTGAAAARSSCPPPSPKTTALELPILVLHDYDTARRLGPTRAPGRRPVLHWPATTRHGRQHRHLAWRVARVLRRSERQAGPGAQARHRPGPRGLRLRARRPSPAPPHQTARRRARPRRMRSHQRRPRHRQDRRRPRHPRQPPRLPHLLQQLEGTATNQRTPPHQDQDTTADPAKQHDRHTQRRSAGHLLIGHAHGRTMVPPRSADRKTRSTARTMPRVTASAGF